MSEATVRGRIDEFRAAVARFLDPAHIRAPDASCTVDGTAPEVVVEPDTPDHLARVLAEARSAGLAVIPVGGGCHLVVGNVPAAYDVALSLRRLDAVIAHEPGDMTVTVQAGVRLADLQRALAAHNQALPLDPPGADVMTVGGVIAANASGPLRHACGTARDWVIGMTVALPDGTLVKSGGRVVKNVTGYDMHKLHAGALGTLGVIVQVTCKLAPRPPVRTPLAATFASARDACRFVIDAWDAGLALEAAEVLSPTAANVLLGGERWTVIARASGVPAAVDRTLDDLRRGAAQLGDGFDAGRHLDTWPRWHAAFAPAGVALRAFVAPSVVADTIEALDRRFAGAAPLISSTVSAGVVRAVLDQEHVHAPAFADTLAGARRHVDGALVIDAAPRALKEQLDVFGPPRADFAIMRRLKQQFDPDGVLSPGRFLGRL
jgi:glycolate oxidase FAD binding subunit